MSDAAPGAAGLLTVAPGSAVVAVPQTPRLVLRHPVFKTFEDPFFRLSDIDQRPVLVIRMDDHDASLPIAGMMREFGISALDEDGRMLALVVRALPFVTGLRIGDRLPPEILSGEASWRQTRRTTPGRWRGCGWGWRHGSSAAACRPRRRWGGRGSSR